MTIDEVIRILDPETSKGALLPYAYDSHQRRKVVDEACRVAVDELRKRQWISVKDRLPEPMYQVLIYTDDGWIGVDALDYNEEFREYDYVTHWQPLPEPPKEPSKKGV